MDRAVGGNAEIAVELAQRRRADLARGPMRLLVLATQDEAFDLLGQLVGVARLPPRAVGERLKAAPCNDRRRYQLVSAGLSR
jgi:hypothetical protein